MDHPAAVEVNPGEELGELIEKITHSGSPSLDLALLKKIKAICRLSDTNVREAYKLVVKYLAKKHAEVRLSAFQVLNELFIRSNQFRELALADFKKLALLVTGTDAAHPLPPPKEAATKLKKESLLAIKEWNQKFGSGYQELRLGYNYLKYNKKVDFEELLADSQAERRRRDQRDARRRTILLQRVQEVKQEMEELKREVRSCLTEVEACFNLLLPRFDMPDIYQSHDPEKETSGVLGKGLIQRLAGDGPVGWKIPPVKKRRITSSSCSSFVSLGSTLGEEDELDEEARKEAEFEPVGAAITKETGGGEERVLERDGGLKERPAGTAAAAGDGSEGMAPSGAAPPPPSASASSSQALSGAAPPPPCASSADLAGSDSDSEVEWEEVPPDGGVCDEDQSLPPAGEAEWQEHGLSMRGLVVPVTIGRVVELEETEDNSSILTSLRENRQLLLFHFLPTLSKCMEWMTKAGEEASVRAAIDLKSVIHSALAKYNRLNITDSTHHSYKTRDATPPYQDKLAASMLPKVTDSKWKFGGDVQTEASREEMDPTTAHAQFAKLRQKKQETTNSSVPGTAPSQATPSQGEATPIGEPVASESLKARAPVVPFGMDLYHWADPSSKVEPKTLAPMGSLHRFWAEEKEVNISQDEQNRLKCRTISFAGSFQPVAKSCRALLPSGKLCPRKDRFKCPFHGPIIPRDQYGNPVRQEETGEDAGGLDGGASSSSFSDDPLWNDEDFQRDLLAATGLASLGESKGKKKGRGKKKAKYPGLTDLSTLTKTPRQRLENKLLSKKVMKRVSQDMDKISAKKFDDKFGNNFNYALKN